MSREMMGGGRKEENEAILFQILKAEVFIYILRKKLNYFQDPPVRNFGILKKF